MKRVKKLSKHPSYSWLPIDSRLLPKILSFGHVKGVARVFLQIEMMAATLVVLGTGIIVLLTVFK